MKKTLFAKLIAVLVVVCSTIFVATACDFGFGEGESSSSVSSFYEQSESSSLEDSSSAEDSSGGEDEGENGLEFSTVQTENNVGSISVSNSTEKFSFADEITVIGNAKYVVSLDEYGINTSLTKVVPLTVGDNLFYIFEMVNDEIQNTYLITVRRRPIYTVSFNTDGGTAIQSQRVEEGSLAVIPEENPTKNGYEFTSWAFDFSSPIMQTTSISVNWSAVTYSITYDLAGGCFEGELTTEYTIESNFSLQTPSRDAYEFLGWYDGNTKITTLNGRYGNKTLTAKWESIFNYSNGVITGLKSKYQNLTQIVIPEEINGEKITAIGSDAFYNCSSLTSVEIPNSVTSIADYAFYNCSSLTSVVIPDSVTSIAEAAFRDCSSLTSVVIGDSVTSIGDFVFSGCDRLTSIEVSENNVNYKDIDGNLYSEDGSVLIQYAIGKTTTSFTIPDSVTSIGDLAFRGCSSLTSVVIGDSVTSIGGYAFRGCSSLTSVVIGDSVTSIGGYAFFGCSSLTSVVIPDSVTSIGEFAFWYCSSLTSVVIPNSVTSIAEAAFYNCESLTSVVIPNSVTSIADHAFRDCSSLTSVVIPNSVTSIGGYAFYNCSSLTSVEIPNSVTSIGYSVFYNCSSLTSVVIPDSVTSIGNSAFEDCSSLTSVEIPASVTSIGFDAFRYCSSLTSIKYRGTAEDWNAIPKDSGWDNNTGSYTITYNYIGE